MVQSSLQSTPMPVKMVLTKWQHPQFIIFKLNILFSQVIFSNTVRGRSHYQETITVDVPAGVDSRLINDSQQPFNWCKLLYLCHLKFMCMSVCCQGTVGSWLTTVTLNIRPETREKLLPPIKQMCVWYI